MDGASGAVGGACVWMGENLNESEAREQQREGGTKKMKEPESQGHSKTGTEEVEGNVKAIII